MMKKIFKFAWNYGRGGEVEGLFVATQEDVDAAIGQDVYFGEILGKHSEVEGTLEADDITVVSDAAIFVDMFEESVGKSFGHNPLDYIDAD
jgi:hypothetical protein